MIVPFAPGGGADTIGRIIALARAKPGSLNFGSAGNGSVEHLGGELFKVLTGVDMVHVPYKGTGPSLTDLLGGRIQMLFENLPPVLGHIRAGRLKALAVGTTSRSSFLPELPTIGEAGVPGYDASSWFGLLAPAKTPGPIVARLNAKTVSVLRGATVRERFAALGAEPVGGTPEEFGAHLAAKLQEVKKLVKFGGVKME